MNQNGYPKNREKRISNISALAASEAIYVHIFDLNSHFFVQSSDIRHISPILSSFVPAFSLFFHSYR